MVRCALLVIALSGAACRGEARQTSANDATLARIVDSLRAPVERAVGLVFTSTPRSAMRTKEQVRGYLIRKLDEELPPDRLRGLETTYRLFGLLPDTLHLRARVQRGNEDGESNLEPDHVALDYGKHSYRLLEGYSLAEREWVVENINGWSSMGGG